MELLKQNSKNKERLKGFTLVELLVASGVTIIVLAVVGLVYVSSNRGFKFGRAALESEADLRLAMDWITRDIREAEEINISGGTVTLQMPSSVCSGPVVYVWNEDKSQLTRAQGSSAKLIVNSLTKFDVSTGDTVAITLSSVKPQLNKERILTSKVTLRNTQ